MAKVERKINQEARKFFIKYDAKKKRTELSTLKNTEIGKVDLVFGNCDIQNLMKPLVNSLEEWVKQYKLGRKYIDEQFWLYFIGSIEDYRTLEHNIKFSYTNRPIEGNTKLSYTGKIYIRLEYFSEVADFDSSNIKKAINLLNSNIKKDKRVVNAVESQMAKTERKINQEVRKFFIKYDAKKKRTELSTLKNAEIGKVDLVFGNCDIQNLMKPLVNSLEEWVKEHKLGKRYIDEQLWLYFVGNTEDYRALENNIKFSYINRKIEDNIKLSYTGKIYIRLEYFSEAVDFDSSNIKKAINLLNSNIKKDKGVVKKDTVQKEFYNKGILSFERELDSFLKEPKLDAISGANVVEKIKEKERKGTLNFEQELDNLLKECRVAATSGITVADKNQRKIEVVIKNIEKTINELNFYSKDMKIPQECLVYKNELESVQKHLNTLNTQMARDLETSKESIENFTITVFGKTTVGKSTLMEVLTHGDGKSIGKGAQRTTVDVRKYKWKNITITDVPGICAAKEGGEKDSKLAFKEAEYADLILFLVSDDAPQEEEAAGLAEIKNMGKPVVCILNVKACGISNKFSNKMRIRKVEHKMQDIKRLDDIKKQFLDYAFKYNQNWNNIPFIYTDLNTAYLAQQPEYNAEKEKFYILSNFEKVTDAIIEEVSNRGTFYQFKTLIDLAYKNSMEAYYDLISQYVSSSKTYTHLCKERSKILDVKNKYDIVAKKNIDSCFEDIVRNLKQEVFSFAERYYADDRASEKWLDIVKTMDIDKKLEYLVTDLQHECRKKLEEFCAKLPEGTIDGINYKVGGIQGDDPWDIRFGMGLGALAIPFLVTGVIPGLIAAIGYSLFTSLITDSKEKKVRKRKEALRNQLNYWIDGSGIVSSEEREKITPWIPQLRAKVNKAYKDILNIFEDVIKYYDNLILQLSKINVNQFNLSKELNKILYELNDEIIDKGLSFFNVSRYATNIFKVLRIPGEAVLIVFNESVTRKNIAEMRDLKKILVEIKKLLQENMYISVKTSAYDLIDVKDRLTATKNEINHLVRLHEYSEVYIKEKDNGIYVCSKARIEYNNLMSYSKIEGLNSHQVEQLSIYKKENSAIVTLCKLIGQAFNVPVYEMEE